MQHRAAPCSTVQHRTAPCSALCLCARACVPPPGVRIAVLVPQQPAGESLAGGRRRGRGRYGAVGAVGGDGADPDVCAAPRGGRAARSADVARRRCRALCALLRRHRRRTGTRQRRGRRRRHGPRDTTANAAADTRPTPGSPVCQVCYYYAGLITSQVYAALVSRDVAAFTRVAFLAVAKLLAVALVRRASLPPRRGLAAAS